MGLGNIQFCQLNLEHYQLPAELSRVEGGVNGIEYTPPPPLTTEAVHQGPILLYNVNLLLMNLRHCRGCGKCLLKIINLV